MSKKDDQRRAEKIALAWMLDKGARHPVKSGGSRFQRVDIWAADVVAFLDNGIVAVQVTTGTEASDAVGQRRRKLAAIGWPICAYVVLMQVRRVPGRLIAYEYRITTYALGTWGGFNAWMPVPREWWDSKALDKQKRNG